VLYQTAVAETTSTVRSPLLYQSSTVAGVQAMPRILGHDRKVGQAFALQAWPAQLTCSTRWGRIVERCVQTQAGNERHGPGQETPAACQESEAGVSGIGHRNNLPFGPPAPDQEEHLPCPVGYLLVPFASLGGVALRRSKDTQKRQRPHAARPGHRHQEHQAHPPEAAALYEALMGRAHGIAVDSFGCYLLAPAPLQGFVYTDHQWALLLGTKVFTSNPSST
jgi:hypothetical protein